VNKRAPQRQQKKRLKNKKSVHFLDSSNRCAATKIKEKRRKEEQRKKLAPAQGN
jgi:hypothetical protein